jgi:hypothetical protein
MKVFDLGCEQGHRFEGWFRSGEDFVQQRENARIECPFCGSAEITKCLSAPRLNLGQKQTSELDTKAPEAIDAGDRTGDGQRPRSGRDAGNEQAPQRQSSGPVLDPQVLQTLWFRMARHLIAHTEDVGENFSTEARKIRDDEAPQRAIRGVATVAQTQALLDEGIEVFNFPLPKDINGPLQ